MKRKVEMLKWNNRPRGELELERFVDMIENEWARNNIAPFDGYTPVKFSLEWSFYRRGARPLRPARATTLWMKLASCIEKRGFVGKVNLDCGGAVFTPFKVYAAPKVILRWWRE